MEFQIFEYFCFAPSYTRNAPTNRSQNNGNVPIASCITKWREAFPLGTFPFGNAISRSHGNVPKKYWCIRPQVKSCGRMHQYFVALPGAFFRSRERKIAASGNVPQNPYAPIFWERSQAIFVPTGNDYRSQG